MDDETLCELHWLCHFQIYSWDLNSYLECVDVLWNFFTVFLWIMFLLCIHQNTSELQLYHRITFIKAIFLHVRIINMLCFSCLSNFWFVNGTFWGKFTSKIRIYSFIFKTNILLRHNFFILTAITVIEWCACLLCKSYQEHIKSLLLCSVMALHHDYLCNKSSFDMAAF